MKTVAVLSAAIILSVFATNQSFAGPDRTSKLAALGEQMELSPAQQQQWQSLLDNISAQRKTQRSAMSQLLSGAETELQKSDADIGKLISEADQAAANSQQARASNEAAFLQFYQQATPAQQQQMREFALTKLQHVDKMRSMHSAFVPGE